MIVITVLLTLELVIRFNPFICNQWKEENLSILHVVYVPQAGY